MTDWLDRHSSWLLPLFAVAVWLVWCLPPLLQNRPEAFQASGSVIVVIAVLIYARERSQREAEITRAQHDQIEAILDQHDTWGNFHEVRAKRDSQQNELRALQLQLAIEKKPTNKKAIEKHIGELEAALSASEPRFVELQQRLDASYDHSMEVVKAGESTVKEKTLAARLLQRLEIALVVLGTLQWGYGDHWVRMLHGINP